MSSNGEAVVLENVSKTFQSKDGSSVRALDALSLRIRDGEFISFLGPSGCGKSTALRIIDGVEHADPGGHVVVQGEPVAGPGFDRARVFQTFALLPWKTVRENVELGLLFQGVAADERRRRSLHYLELLGLGGFATKYPPELSGGMRQRVGLARALAMEASVLLADEPFASVDALTRENLQAEILRIWELTRRTLVFVTHSIEEAIVLSDRIVVFSPRPGRICLDLEVALPRPRTHAHELPEFAALRKQIWDTFVEMGVLTTSGGGAAAVPAGVATGNGAA
ncbi:MAG TPA: ABC transporter ATP-binding protein [Gaiellaceae bacterium]|nr:ABC transporter ATP-binding protein [Gaiellaceae bacterium]